MQPAARRVDVPTAVAVAVCLSGVAALALQAQPAPPRTTRDGVFSAEQAERGLETYQQHCAACHPMDLYKGETVKAWNGAPIYSIYEVIFTKMPQSNPGSLKPREYVDILAYIFALNDQPAGKEDLSAQPSVLKEIKIEWNSEP